MKRRGAIKLNKWKNISLDKLIYPLFVKEARGVVEEISSLPGVYRYSPDTLVKEVSTLQCLGLKSVLLFGIPRSKDWAGSSATGEDNVVSESVRLLRKYFPELVIITDVCLCAYTSSGHCGVIKQGSRQIDAKTTLSALSGMALTHAQAGANYVAPSAMADTQVKSIRKALDKEGYQQTKIIGYSAKFASNFYGPFRDVADSAPRFGSRHGYQLDYNDSKTALYKVEQDIREGADIVMVKPALGYLDIVKKVKSEFNYPLAVYNVSGEYAMVKAGAGAGSWDEGEMVFEIISSIKRAGADFIISYHAKDIARWQKR
ncbi:MAG: porphobilinogen synthase [Candidatus Omnitrophota bacterium]